MKRQIFFLLALAVVIPAVQAIDIDPGQTVYINCNMTNESVSVSCNLTGNQTINESCPSCGTCSIDKELLPGEFYERQEGVCDIEILCEGLEDEGTETRPRDYLFNLHVDKHEGQEIDLSIEIKDPYGTIIESKHYAPFDESDIVTAEYRYNFTCPTKILIDTVDKQSCFKYLDEYVGENDPLSYILAQQTTDYKDDLMECQGNLIATNSLMKDNKDLYTDCQSEKHVTEGKLQDANTKLNETEAKIRAEYRDHVPGSWMWAAIGEGIVFLLILGAVLLPSPEGGKK